MYKKENYVKVYEMYFEESHNLDRKKFFILIQDALKHQTQISTEKGLFYIKEIQSKKYTDIILFGKDNIDASNYKRNKKKLKFEKININEKKEVLTDFIHIAISKKYTKKRGSIKGCTIFMEKSSHIQISAFVDYINHIVSSPLLISIGRRVVSDYNNIISNASRILEITKTKKDEGLPISNQNDYENDDIIVNNNIEIKAKPKGSLPLSLFKDLIKDFDNSDNKTRMTVKVIDNHNNVIPIDFDKISSQFSIQYSIPLNKKTDKIQEDIMAQMNWTMNLDNKGEI